MIPKKKILLNSAAGVTQTILSSVVIFVTIPIFLKKLGPELFGIFSLLQLIGNVNVFVNLGMNISLLKFISEQGKTKESDYDILTILLLSAAIMLPLSILLIVYNQYCLAVVLNISPPYLNRDTFFVFNSLIISNFLVLMGQPFTAMLDSQQKIYLTNLCQFIYNFTYWALILGLLFLFSSFLYVGIAILISSCIWFLLIAAFAIKQWGKPVLNDYSRHAWRIIKKHIRYGVKLYTGNMINFFYEPFTKLLITHFIGVVYVGYFDIALKIKTQVFSIIQKVFHPITPLISNLTNFDEIKKLVLDLQQKTIILVTPAVMLTFMLTPTIIALWLGPGRYLVADAAAFTLAGTLLFSITILPLYSFFMTKDHTGKIIIIQATNVVTNLLFIILTYKSLGFYSVILGNPLALLASFLISAGYQRKYMGHVFFPETTKFMSFFVYFLSIEIIGAVFLLVHFTVWIRVLLGPPVVLITALVLIWRLRLITSDDLRRYFGNKKKTGESVLTP